MDFSKNPILYEDELQKQFKTQKFSTDSIVVKVLKGHRNFQIDDDIIEDIKFVESYARDELQDHRLNVCLLNLLMIFQTLFQTMFHI